MKTKLQVVDATGLIEEGMWNYGPPLPPVRIRKPAGKGEINYSFTLNSRSGTYLARLLKKTHEERPRRPRLRRGESVALQTLRKLTGCDVAGRVLSRPNCFSTASIDLIALPPRVNNTCAFPCRALIVGNENALV